MMDYELIHVNLGLASYPLNSEEMRSFWVLEGPIVELAKSYAGFSRELHLSDRFSVFPEPYVLNASAWRNIEDLKEFVYTGLHATAFKERKRWFVEREASKATDQNRPLPKYVLFWAPKGMHHSEKSLAEKMFTYAENGPTCEAFGFKSHFPKPS